MKKWKTKAYIASLLCDKYIAPVTSNFAEVALFYITEEETEAQRACVPRSGSSCY